MNLSSLGLSALFCLLLCHCASHEPAKPKLTRSTSSSCEASFRSLTFEDGAGSLDQLSSLSHMGCDLEVISAGSFIRQKFHDKVYSLVAETSELFTPEGSSTSYVLESHERAFLSFLISTSYFHLNRKEEATIEMRRAREELAAWIYNYGEDPANLILQAVIWENAVSPFEARPFWKRVHERFAYDAALKGSSQQQIKAIDEKKSPSRKWKVYTLGKFPQLDWKFDWDHKEGGYYKITSPSFPKNCFNEDGILVNTEAWAKKISHRYDHSYHPLLNWKGWTRLPVGLTYGAATTLAGVSIGVGACMIDGSAHGNGKLCEAGINAGTEVASKTGDVVEYALKPDLRHWRNVPEAFWITREDSFDNKCLKALRKDGILPIQQLL